MDLIDRQVAIETINGDKFDVAFCTEYGEGYNDGIDFAVSTLSTLPSAQPDLSEILNEAHNEGYDVGYWAGRRDYEPRWIPVTERLPEVNGRYLVTRGLNTCGVIWNRVYLVNYSDLMGIISKRIWWSGNVGKSDFERLEDVLAWMPLPEPYKERREDERDYELFNYRDFTCDGRPGPSSISNRGN